ncbi:MULTISPECIES: ABC transporter permease/substrate-binding protein [Clostridium]|uniref:ABC transporter permease/substrate-binding protein n=1 Tax=Clostridium TaxID=1485 RepID=UPI00069DDCDC|nr:MULTISPECIES: glycine betaine ABC transporter substrate-binding protein [Clostridium]KOF57234.1 ABC transporter permease [Clostridium sp. DMHC 10]MCD2346607.1 ABC transporter permease subunit [Clostridium guangxiense]
MSNFVNFILERKDQIFTLFLQHIELTIFAVLVSIIVGVPLGILITRVRKLSTPVIAVANIAQSIPSLALLGFLIPVFGIGSKPSIIMVVIYSLLPIIKNTYTGLINIDAPIIEAATGVGLTKSQILLKISIPLAMPIIMSGIRISAVTAVGLMTIAAFVGAGGLGYLVFSGVQTVNNYMILAGAIPACFLALFLDFIIGKVEEHVVPEGIRISKGEKIKRRKIKNRKFNKILAAVLAVIIVVVSCVAFYNSRNKKVIVIGSKNFNEQLILGNMVASLIEHDTDYKVEKKLNLGGTNVVFSAMKSGDVDLYVEYTGTGLVDIMKRNSISDKDKVYNMVKDYFDKEYNMEWLKPIGFNNTYVLSMKKELANKYNINTISDLSKMSNNFTLGSTMEFLNRADGYLGLQKTYNINFKNTKGLDGGLRYSALNKNETQVTDAFSTDGLLKKFDLKTLKDDKNFFPPYYAVPLVKKETLEKYPKLKGVLEKLQDKITDSEMRELNYRVDSGEKPEKVADDFLRSKGLIK